MIEKFFLVVTYGLLKKFYLCDEWNTMQEKKIFKFKDKVNFVADSLSNVFSSNRRWIEFIHDSHGQTLFFPPCTYVIYVTFRFGWKDPASKWEVKFWKMDDSPFATRGDYVGPTLPSVRLQGLLRNNWNLQKFHTVLWNEMLVNFSKKNVTLHK